jgi:hypothetical protein
MLEGEAGRAKHLHYLGERTLKQRAMECAGAPLHDMLQSAFHVSEQVRRSPNGFRVASCVRDPISRQISHLFKFPEISQKLAGLDVYSNPDGARRWMVEAFHRRRPLTWFEEQISEPFGVDLFGSPFDRVAGTLRLVHGGARIVVIRFEDPAATRETGLGWLLERERLIIPVVDRSSDKATAMAYKRFCDAFIAPDRLIEAVYESKMMKHFYVEAELHNFRNRWSSRQT